MPLSNDPSTPTPPDKTPNPESILDGDLDQLSPEQIINMLWTHTYGSNGQVYAHAQNRHCAPYAYFGPKCDTLQVYIQNKQLAAYLLRIETNPIRYDARFKDLSAYPWIQQLMAQIDQWRAEHPLPPPHPSEPLTIEQQFIKGYYNGLLGIQRPGDST